MWQLFACYSLLVANPKVGLRAGMLSATSVRLALTNFVFLSQRVAATGTYIIVKQYNSGVFLECFDCF